MRKLLMFLNTYLIWTIFLFFLFIILLILGMILKSFGNIYGSIATLCISLILLISDCVLTIIAGIKIITSDWKYKKLNDQKTLWGILTIVILGWIAILVFKILATKEYNNDKNTNQYIELQNNEPINY